MKKYFCFFCLSVLFPAVIYNNAVWAQEQSAEQPVLTETVTGADKSDGQQEFKTTTDISAVNGTQEEKSVNEDSVNTVPGTDSGDDNWIRASAKLIGAIWREGSWEVFAPLHAWHNREAYPKYKIDGYNEEPWGFGIGRYRMDYKNNRDGILAIGFSDSNWHFEPLLLYSWEKIWRDRRDFFRFSAGYVAGFTTRKEWHWCPIPMALPIVSVEAGPFSYSNTYIPGLGKENGNVWFSWASVRF
ncbi:MAG: lipid IV(A) palmitoyltransferase PagP [Elusimicrobiales bacterium]|nr:lipid IV(A) palmitoyltransferase PagP [Elusimicrobiales bacterium]